MKVLRAILESFKIKSIKIAIYLWIFNFFLGFLVYYFLFHLFSVTAGDTLFLRNFSLQNIWPYLLDIFQNNKSIPVLLFSILMLFLALFILISIFTSGGIFSILLNQEEKTFKNLLISSFENFIKIFKVFLINLISWIFVTLFSGIILYIIWLIQKNSGNESLVKIMIYFWIVITICLFILAMAIYDFSRIVRLKTDRNFMFSFKNGIKFVFSNKMIILFLYIINIVSIILSHFLLWVLLDKVENMLDVLFLLIIYQTYILLKYYIKTVIMNAEVNIYMSFFTKFEGLD